MELNEINNSELFTFYNEVINGTKRVPKNDLVPCSDYFTERGYYVVRPFAKSSLQKDQLIEFFTKFNEFDLDSRTLFDLTTAFKLDRDQERIIFAASFFIAKVYDHLIAHLVAIKTAVNCRKRGYGSKFIKDLRAFIIANNSSSS